MRICVGSRVHYHSACRCMPPAFGPCGSVQTNRTRVCEPVASTCVPREIRSARRFLHVVTTAPADVSCVRQLRGFSQPPSVAPHRRGSVAHDWSEASVQKPPSHPKCLHTPQDQLLQPNGLASKWLAKIIYQ